MRAFAVEYRRLFHEYYGDNPPWDCWFCKEPIMETGQSGQSLIRHHIDGDQYNNDPEYLVPAHRSCHNKGHARPNSVMSDEGRARVSAARKAYIAAHYEEICQHLDDVR